MRRGVAVIIPRMIAPVYGAGVAYNEWINGILTYASFSKCDLYCHPADRERVEEIFCKSAKARVCPLEALPQNLRTRQYEALICRGLSDTAGLCAIRDEAGKGVPPVCSITMALSYYRCLTDMFFNMLTCNPAFDLFFCGTQAAQQVMMKFIDQLKTAPGVNSTALSEENLILVPHGVDLQLCSSLPSKADCKKHLNIPQEASVMLSVGRLSFYDKIDYRCLLEAFAMIKRAVSNRRIRLLIAGDNKERGASLIHALANEMGVSLEVNVITSFRKEQKPIIYGAADIFVSLANSVQESFGLTLLEAMAAGLPVVATDWDGYRDLLSNGQHGYLVKTRWRNELKELAAVSPIISIHESHRLLAEAVEIDPAEVAKKVILLLEDTTKYSEMAAKAKRRAEEFAWPTIIRSAEQHWRKSYVKATSRCFGVPTRNWLFLDYLNTFGHYATPAE